MSSISKSCYYHIRQLCCIRPYLDTKTTSAIATSIVHSKLDYCNSLPKSQITRLQQIQNSLARAVVKAPKSSRITSILRSLHWLKITEHIEYKLLSLTFKVLTTTKPSYLHNIITIQPSRSTRSSSLVTLARSSVSSSLRITGRSFLYAPPHLWNQLPASLHELCTNHSNSDSPSPMSGTSVVPSTNHSHHSSPPHSFIPGLKPFSLDPSHHSLLFLLHGFHGLFTDICLLLFSFSFCVVDEADLVSFWALVK